MQGAGARAIGDRAAIAARLHAVANAGVGRAPGRRGR
jgi:hypothetical protein